MLETGTLEELDVKPGDVVECERDFCGNYTNGKHYTINSDGLTIQDDGFAYNGLRSIFLIISRTSDTPKLWRDMSDEEKGALLLARHEGKVIEFLFQGEWKPTASCGLWEGYVTYRVKPEPVRETVAFYTSGGEGWAVFNEYTKFDTHRITFDLIDGKPDLDSIKMEEA